MHVRVRQTLSAPHVLRTYQGISAKIRTNHIPPLLYLSPAEIFTPILDSRAHVMCDGACYVHSHICTKNMQYVYIFVYCSLLCGVCCAPNLPLTSYLL